MSSRVERVTMTSTQFPSSALGSLKGIELSSFCTKFQAVNDQIERIDLVYRNSVADSGNCIALLSGLKVCLLELDSETKNAKKKLLERSESLNSDLSESMTMVDELAEECKSISSECASLDKTVTQLDLDCSSMQTKLDEVASSINEIEKAQKGVKEKRWNMLRDLVPLYALGSGIKQGDLKSGLLRSIPGYSIAVGAKSLVKNELGKLQTDLEKLEAARGELKYDRELKMKELSHKIIRLHCEQSSLRYYRGLIAETTINLNASKSGTHLLNAAHVELGLLLNSSFILSVGSNSLNRKCDQGIFTNAELGKFIVSCKQFKERHGKLIVAGS